MGQKGMCLVVIVCHGLPSFSKVEHTQSDLVWSRGVGRHTKISSRHAVLLAKEKNDPSGLHTHPQLLTKKH